MPGLSTQRVRKKLSISEKNLYWTVDTLNLTKAEALVPLLILGLGSYYRIQVLFVFSYFIVEIGF